jgi:hypothetical protein
MNGTELPNPTTDLAFLPPEVAHEVQIGRYIMVGTLGVSYDKRIFLQFYVKFRPVARLLSGIS